MRERERVAFQAGWNAAKWGRDGLIVTEAIDEWLALLASTEGAGEPVAPEAVEIVVSDLMEVAQFLDGCRGTEPAEYFERHAARCRLAADFVRRCCRPTEGERVEGFGFHYAGREWRLFTRDETPLDLTGWDGRATLILHHEGGDDNGNATGDSTQSHGADVVVGESATERGPSRPSGDGPRGEALEGAALAGSPTSARIVDVGALAADFTENPVKHYVDSRASAPAECEVERLKTERGRLNAALELAEWETRTAEAEVARLRERVAVLRHRYPDEVWIWQSDGDNDLDSLTCPVVISAEALREIVGEVARLREALESSDSPRWGVASKEESRDEG